MKLCFTRLNTVKCEEYEYTISDHWSGPRYCRGSLRQHPDP